jgi:hypothetical protein
MTDNNVRPLPILWPEGYEPTSEDWAALRTAKNATGYPGLVVPRKAVYGSPGVILAVGALPDWLARFAYIDTLSDIGRLTVALNAILNDPEDPRIGGPEELLSRWMGVEVKQVDEYEDEELVL